MTDNPPPINPDNSFGQPHPYAIPNYAAIQSSRPGSITVMSILAIVFGSLGLLCGAIGLLGQLVTFAMGGRNPFMANVPAMKNLAVTGYGAFAAMVVVILAATLLAGGIGGLKFRPWARPLMIWWSIVTLAWATINLIIMLVWVNPVTADYIRQVQRQTNPQAAQMMGSMMGPLQVIQAFINWGLACILPICFLFLWRSQKVVEAFAPPDVQGFQR